MRKLCTFHPSDAPMAAMYKRILAVEGVATMIRNDRLGAAMGEIPFVECFPELWVLEDADLEWAQEVLAAYQEREAPTATPWKCTACGETVDGELSSCWKCETPHPS